MSWVVQCFRRHETPADTRRHLCASVHNERSQHERALLQPPSYTHTVSKIKQNWGWNGSRVQLGLLLSGEESCYLVSTNKTTVSFISICIKVFMTVLFGGAQTNIPSDTEQDRIRASWESFLNNIWHICPRISSNITTYVTYYKETCWRLKKETERSSSYLNFH